MAAHLPLASSPAAIAPALSRNVYKLRVKLLGLNGYFALTSGHQVLGDCVHLVNARETDAQIVKRLRTELDQEDPMLKLLQRTVEASIDGPSSSHPQLRLEEDGEPVIDIPEADFPAAFCDEVTADLYHRLASALHQRLA